MLLLLLPSLYLFPADFFLFAERPRPRCGRQGSSKLRFKNYSPDRFPYADIIILCTRRAAGGWWWWRRGCLDFFGFYIKRQQRNGPGDLR